MHSCVSVWVCYFDFDKSPLQGHSSPPPAQDHCPVHCSPICVASMCWMRSVRLGNWIPHSLNLHTFSRKTAISLGIRFTRRCLRHSSQHYFHPAATQARAELHHCSSTKLLLGTGAMFVYGVVSCVATIVCVPVVSISGGERRDYAIANIQLSTAHTDNFT